VLTWLCTVGNFVNKERTVLSGGEDTEGQFAVQERLGALELIMAVIKNVK
jgi:hypothetical protein